MVKIGWLANANVNYFSENTESVSVIDSPFKAAFRVNEVNLVDVLDGAQPIGAFHSGSAEVKCDLSYFGESSSP